MAITKLLMFSRPSHSLHWVKLDLKWCVLVMAPRDHRLCFWVHLTSACNAIKCYLICDLVREVIFDHSVATILGFDFQAMMYYWVACVLVCLVKVEIEMSVCLVDLKNRWVLMSWSRVCQKEEFLPAYNSSVSLHTWSQASKRTNWL